MPTPVSALIHAATMVTAGVYLLIRSSPLIEYSSTILLLCLWLGAITTVFSSLIGLFQQDIKKVIAYSTMSQLGMMVIAIGLSSYNVALFHLVNHAFYKGLLFLGAGAVIHAVADNQDFRKYGGLISFLPLTYSVILIASLSLVAFPFMTGFYSKDFILESAFGQYYFSSIAVYVIAVIGAIFTTLYSVKVLYLTFLSPALGPKTYYVKAHEGDIWLSLPLVILALFSIFFGYITKDIFIGLGSNFFIDNSIFIHPNHEIMIDTEFGVPTMFKLLPFVFTVSFSLLAIIISEFLPESLISLKFSRFGYNVFGFFNQRFLIEMFYNKYITNLVLSLGGQTTKVLDKGAIELIGPYGLELGLIKLSKNISKLSTGVVTSYALYILIGFIAYISINYFESTVDNLGSFILLLLMGLLSFLTEDKLNTRNISSEGRLLSTFLPFHLPYLNLVKGNGRRRISGVSLASNGVLYSNPGKDKKSMLEDNREKSGIYMWNNKINNKTYIGSSQNLRVRILDYFDNHTLNSNGSLIYKAILKYGYDNFTFQVLEYCPTQDLMEREQYYLDTVQPEYNILKFARSSRGYRHTEVSKQLWCSARQGWKFTSEHLDNFSLNSVRNKSTLLTNTVTEEAILFPSMGQAAEYLGVSVTTIRSYIDKKLSYNDYIISQPYLKQDEENKLSSKPQTIVLTKVSDSLPTQTEEFPTIQAAAEYLGVNRGTLNNILNNSENTDASLCNIKGFIVSKSDKSLNYIKPNSKALEVTDQVNNTTVTYPSLTSVALALDVGKGSISMYLKGKQTSPFKNRYIIKSNSAS